VSTPTLTAPRRPGVHRSVLVTPHWAATAAGREVLAAGGSAVDAAVAAAAALCVAYPHNTSLGGDLVALVRTPDGVVRCVNATGPAGAATDAAALRDRLGLGPGEPMPAHGPDTVTVPGAVRGWQVLLDLAGRTPFADLLAPAVRLAADGVAVSRSLHRAIRWAVPDLKEGGPLADLLTPGGAPLRHGEVLRQPALARTLSRLAAGGPEEFCTGALAADLVAGLAARGGLLTTADLAAFVPETTDPLRWSGDDGNGGVRTVLTSPPNTQGFALLRTLAAAAAAGLSAADALGRGVEVLARELHDGGLLRDGFLADPRTGGPSAGELLHVDPHALPTVPSHRRTLRAAAGDTVGISAVDEDGTAVSLIQSLYGHFGSHVLDPGTGVLFQNRGTSFSLDPTSANVLAPGKRPSHTLMPVMSLRGSGLDGGELETVCSVMGGKAQPQVQTQVLLGAFAGRTAAEAVCAPRWVVGPLDPTDHPEGARLEEDADDTVAAGLEAAGFRVERIPAADEDTGQANLVHVLPDGTFDAAADPRADGGCALVERPATEVVA
jgi:gamma-glutamyltranspeptidase/glutathione hydrolase